MKDFYYCSKCGEYHFESKWEDIDYYSEYVDACLLEYKVIKCIICGTEYEVLLNDYEEIEE